MSDEQTVIDTALKLQRLLEDAEFPKQDRFLAEQCLRRLAQPLRLTVFGTDPKHAISLVNLMIGQSVISPSIERARIQFLYSDTPHAKLQYRDGSTKRIEGQDFRRLFDDSPSRVRIYVNLPVLKKVSFFLATEKDAKRLCSDVDKILPPSDISLWTGDDLTIPLLEAWRNMPDRLRDHSYLVLSPKMDMESWKSVAQEFVEIMRVDPRRAQDAKEDPNGVDKAEFKAAGGATIVKIIKREIEVLTQSSLDASEVLFARYDSLLDEPEAAPEPQAEPQAPARETVAEEDPLERPADLTDEIIDRIVSRPTREAVYSVPLGKLASRSRLLGTPTQQPKITARTVSMAIKNMPKTTARPVSKAGPKPRVRSRRSRPNATPWSLGL